MKSNAVFCSLSAIMAYITHPILKHQQATPLPTSYSYIIQSLHFFPQLVMMLSVILALFIPCAAMTAVFLTYLFILWYLARRHIHLLTNSAKPQLKTALSESHLKKLPAVTGKDLVLGTDCAVCLDEICDDDAATMVPGCNHGFHRECAKMWLMRRGECPLCRVTIHPPDLLTSSQNSPL